MGLCIVCEHLPPNYGGADIAAIRYFNEKRSQGENALLVGSWNEGVEQKADVYSIKSSTWSVHPYLNFTLSFPLLMFRTLRFLNRHSREISVIHCFNAYADLVYAMALAGFIHRKKVIFECSLVGSDDPENILRRGVGWRRFLKKGLYIKRPILRKAHAVVSKSPYMTEVFGRTIELRGLQREIPYFVDTSRFRPLNDADKTHMRMKLGLPIDKKILLFVGGINARKGVDVLVEAFEKVNAVFSNTYLVLAGPHNKYKTKYTHDLVHKVREIGIEKIKLPGLCSNVHEYFQSADIYVLPSYREGFPISILEGMCSRLVVIGSAIPEIKDVQIKDGKTGYVFETGSPQDLEIKLLALLKSEDLLKRIGDAGYEWAHEQFSLERITTLYNSLYSEL